MVIPEASAPIKPAIKIAMSAVAKDSTLYLAAERSERDVECNQPLLHHQ